MKIIASLTFLALTFCAAFLDTAGAQPLTITTIAGQFGVSGYTNATGTNALLVSPNRLTADKAGNLYFIDGQSVRKINSALAVTTLAGQQTAFGFQDGTGTDALFHNLHDLAVDQNGTVYVADYDNYAIRKISPAGVVTTLAGDGTPGDLGGEFSNLKAIAVDSATNVYVADMYRIRKITAAGLVTTLAGSSSDGWLDGSGAGAFFYDPYGLAVDAGGTVYVADVFGIRKVSPAGVVTTWVGSPYRLFEADGGPTTAGFHDVMEIVLDRAGGAYVADNSGPTIRHVSPAGVVTTVAGLANVYTPITNSNDGVGSNARFRTPTGVALDTAGNVYIVDQASYTILKGVPPSLPAISGFSETAGITPIRSNNPWQFTAHFTTIVSELWLHVQSTTTTNVEGSWTDLPGNLHMTGVDGNWNLNTTNVPTGTNRYFRAVASAPGYFDSASRPEGPETVLGPPELPGFGAFLVSDGGTPVRSSNPWQFLAVYTNLVSGLQLRVQSTTTNVAGSWQDLPGIYYMTNNAGGWTLDKTDVPTGVRYFRVVAYAPGYVDAVSPIYGPETVLDGIAPFGFFSINTPVPFQTGNLWTFTITESSLISGLQLRVQRSFDLTNWSDLVNGGQMTNSGPTWTLITTSLPIGEQVFRVVASAPTYVDRISAPSAISFDIEPELPAETDNYSTSGFHILAAVDSPQAIYVHAILQAAAEFGCSDNTKYNAAITLAADQYATATLHIADGQHISALALIAGPNGTVEFKGSFTGDVAGEGGSIIHDVKTAEIVKLISQDGSNLVSHDGGSLVSHDGGSLVSHDGGSLASKDGLGIIYNGGGAVVSRNIKGFTPDGNPFQPSPKTPTPTQPTFTGQMTINGNYYQYPGTTLIIGIAGTNTLSDGAQQFDQLDVSGTAYLAGGTIAFGLFDPDDQTNRADVFQPPVGATFDVVVASNIVVGAVHILGPVWGDGLFFSGSVVTRDDGLQAVRLMATHIPPYIFIENTGSELHMVYGTNYTGYTVESSTNLSDWSAFSTGTNVVPLSLTNSSRFFRLSKP